MKRQDIREIITAYKEKALPYLNSFFQTENLAIRQLSPLSFDVLTRIQHMSQKGKFIRGYLLTLGFETTGQTISDAVIDTSTFLEIAQTGILIHDDIMDEDIQRRGMPTLHTVYADMAKKKNFAVPRHYGESVAICAGDIAFYLSWQKLLASTLDRDRIFAAAALYSKYFTRVAYGQISDLSLPYGTPGEKDILDMYLLKTAEYSGAMPLLIGAALAGEISQGLYKALETYGLGFGWIYQISDDLLGMFGDPQVTGKSNTSDLCEGKYTILVSRYLAGTDTAGRKKFSEIFGKKNADPAQLDKIRSSILESDAVAYCERLMDGYFTEAAHSIQKITANKSVIEQLQALLEFVRKRNK